MHPSLAWRSTILQLAWIAAVTTLALVIKLESLQYMLVGGIVAWGGALGAKARASAGSGGDSGTGISIIPGPMGQSLPPGMMNRRESVSPLADTIARLVGFVPKMSALAWVAAAVMLFGIHGVGCKGQTPAQTATEIDAGVAVAKGVCTVVGVATGDPLITLVCPLLDEKGQPVKDANGAPKTAIVKLPRATWEAMTVREKDGGQ
jgi:hypothetical protein